MRLVVCVELLWLAAHLMSKRIGSVLRDFPWSPLVCFGLAWLAMRTETLQQLAWRSLDWRTSLRAHFQAPADPRIALVLFDDDTENNLVSWPPDRAYHGALTQLLSLAKPAVITWDVILDAPREGDGDEVMGQSVQAAAANGTAVITGAVTSPDPVEAEATAKAGLTQPITQVEGDVGRVFGDEHALVPFPQLRAAGRYGFVDAPKGADGIVRELPLVVRVGRELYPSLTLQTVMAYHHLAAKDVKVRLGDGVYLPVAGGEERIPISATGMYFVNYRYDNSLVLAAPVHGDETPAMQLDYRVTSYRAALLTLNSKFVQPVAGTPPPPDFAGKIVMIGQVVTGKADMGPTPRSASSPLVLLHANAVDNILRRDFARRVPEWMVWIGMLLLGYAGIFAALRGSLLVMVSFGLIVIVAYTNLAFWGWIEWSLWFPWVGPLLGFTALQFANIGRRVRAEQRAKEQIRSTFNSYLSPGLLKRVLRNQDLAQVASERRPVTVLFSDLRDFTAWSERTREDVLIAQLNEYLAAMVECIHERGGTLHKFIGDAVMAVWGDLVAGDPAEDAARAVSAALDMQARLRALNAGWSARGLHTLRMGIGLNHGDVLVGNIGSPRRMEFTVIGDAVNLAARLESLNKDQGTEILVGESVKTLVGAKFAFRPIGGVKVKGKSAAVDVFELQGPGG